MQASLAGRTALITGGARRIGRETALALAEQGVGVVIHYNRSEGEARQVAAEIKVKGAKAWTVRADFRHPPDYQSLIARTRAVTGGRLDILINNASIFPAERLGELTWPGLSADLQVNAWVPLTLSREFARGLARGGIINLHDTRLKGFDFRHSGYILSKHVLAELTRMMALELAPNVTVNAVAPGLILPPPGEDERYLEDHAPLVPLKRHGHPRDIAEAIVYLLHADFVTGQVIYVDGGRHLHEWGPTASSFGGESHAREAQSPAG